MLTAWSGREALEIARKHLPDLILSDIMMPELDGYGLLMALREQEATATIPFIFLTGKNDYSDLRKGMSFGADDYVIKPFKHRDLIDAVRTRLDKQADINRRIDQQIKALRHSIVSTLPHEFRTPLTGIMGYVNMLLDNYERLQPEQVIRMLGSVQRSTTRLHRMIHNYLLFVQLELIGIDQERLDLLEKYQNLQPSDPAVIVPVVVEELANQYNRQADVQIVIEPANLRILAEDMGKIVEELVDNAFKFSEAGTAVQITGKVLDGSYEFCILDRGRGMQPEDIKQIGGMRQFSRQVYEQQGMGLGLVIARRLAEIYNGQLTLESTFGEGTSVCVQIKLLH